MDKPVTFAICGLGIRGLEAYAAFQKQHPEKMKITAGADPDPPTINEMAYRAGAWLPDSRSW